MQHIHVAVAVITAADGKILLTQRAKDKHQGGLWEFPGGKREAGESTTAALQREIREELEIEISACEPLIRIPYQYPDLHVVLDVFRVTAFTGQPRGAEGQPMQWVTPTQLNQIPLPAANRPIVRALQLPEHYLITPNSSDAALLYTGVMLAAKQGIQLIQLRAPALPEKDYWPLADRLLRELPSSAQLLLKGSPEQLAARPHAGWHLTSSQLEQLAQQERSISTNRLLAASCHSTAQLQLAAALGCDFATLSPVQPTSSHPDTPALGWPAAEALTLEAQLPVYFLGGMAPTDITQARHSGAQGIAAIRSLWPHQP